MAPHVLGHLVELPPALRLRRGTGRARPRRAAAPAARSRWRPRSSAERCSRSCCCPTSAPGPRRPATSTITITDEARPSTDRARYRSWSSGQGQPMGDGGRVHRGRRADRRGRARRAGTRGRQARRRSRAPTGDAATQTSRTRHRHARATPKRHHHVDRPLQSTKPPAASRAAADRKRHPRQPLRRHPRPAPSPGPRPLLRRHPRPPKRRCPAAREHVAVAASTVGPSAYWYLTRASGTVALVLLTAGAAVRDDQRHAVSARRWPRFVIDGVHRRVSLLAVAFLVDPHPHVGARFVCADRAARRA